MQLCNGNKPQIFIQENKNSDNRNENTSVNILKGLALSYSRDKPGSTRRIEFLSSIAQQYSNKEIKLFLSTLIHVVKDRRFRAPIMK